MNVRTEVICNKVQRLGIVLHLRVQSSQIEAVKYVVFLYIAKVLVTL